MKLSIIIVNWNTKMLLEQCLNSIIQSSILRLRSGQEFKVQSEIVVVDNGSTDSSVETVKELIEKNSRQFLPCRQAGVSGTEKRSKKGELRVPLIRDNSCDPTIRLIENRTNMGFAKAVNQALRQIYTESFDPAQDKLGRSAQGEVILLLNSDTQVKPGTLEKLLEFEEKVRPAIIGARMLNPDGTIQASCFYLPTVGRAIKEYWFSKSGYFSKYAPEGKEPVEVEAVSGGAMLISKGMIEKIGLFDERYFMYFEDLDYCRRAKKTGFKIWYLPTAEIIHEHGASGKTLVHEKEQWRRLIPSSKIYYGLLKHHLINLILWVSQKFQ